MPSKKKKYNARFPAGRIKKIMQTDEEIGKVAQPVPIIISRTLELFVESLLTKSTQITLARNAKTLTRSHMKQCILSESRFDFLKDLVKNIPDASVTEDIENNEAVDYSVNTSRNHESISDVDYKPDIPNPLFYTEQSTSSPSSSSTAAARAPVIQYGPKIMKMEIHPADEDEDRPAEVHVPKLSFSVESLVAPKADIKRESIVSTVPQISPVTQNNYSNASDNLYIDEDYDN